MTDGGVLLLEDDEDLLDTLGELVQRLTDRSCLAVRSFGDLVQRRAEALGCELAILDINLGSGRHSGLDAYEWLKQQGFTGRIAFLTGHARSHPLVARACALDRAAVYQKPIGMTELRRLLGLTTRRASP